MYLIDWRALLTVAPWLTPTQAKRHAAALGPAFHRHHITTPRRAAAAVAQFAHESAGFRTTTEYASGDEYEGRTDLGNTHAGDGRRFKGRGYIQVTGRNNYAALQHAGVVPGALAAPERVATPKYAAQASCWWWEQHGCNALADSGDFVALTRRINGGTNGLAERETYHAKAVKVAERLVPLGRTQRQVRAWSARLAQIRRAVGRIGHWTPKRKAEAENLKTDIKRHGGKA